MTVNFHIDLDSFLYFVAHGLCARKNNPNLLESEADGREFMHTVHVSISQAIQRTKVQPKRIILCKDSKKVWRKQLPAPEVVYKSSRKKEKKFNMDNFRRFSVEYVDTLKSLDIYVFQKDYLESDDMLYLSADAFYNMGQSSIIITRDSDMSQLVKSDGNKFITIFDYVESKFLISKDFKRGNEKPEDFLMSDDVFEFMDGGNFLMVDPHEVLMMKTLGGDKSDDVLSSLYYIKGKAKNPVSLTQPMAVKFIQQYGLFDPAKILENEMRIKLCEDIKTFLNTDLDTTQFKTFVKQVKINLYFVWLNKAVIPKTLIDEFYGHNFLSVMKNTDLFNSHQHMLTKFSSLLSEKGISEMSGEAVKFMISNE